MTKTPIENLPTLLMTLRMYRDVTSAQLSRLMVISFFGSYSKWRLLSWTKLLMHGRNDLTLQQLNGTLSVMNSPLWICL